LWSVHDTAQIIRRGRPAVQLVTEQFIALASAVMRSNQLAESTIVMVPGNPEYVSKEELMRLADRALAQSVDKLTAKAPAQ
jgi:hypothetical protein